MSGWCRYLSALFFECIWTFVLFGRSDRIIVTFFGVLWCWSIQFQNKSALFVMFSNLMILLLIFFRGHFLNDVIYTVSYLIRDIKCCYSHVCLPSFGSNGLHHFFYQRLNALISFPNSYLGYSCPWRPFCLKSKQSLCREKANQLCCVIRQFHKG